MGDRFAGERRRRREGQRCGERHVPCRAILELHGTCQVLLFPDSGP